MTTEITRTEVVNFPQLISQLLHLMHQQVKTGVSHEQEVRTIISSLVNNSRNTFPWLKEELGELIVLTNQKPPH